MSKKKSPKESSDQIFRAVRGEFYESIADVLRTARSNAYRAVNFVMVEAYWNIGRMIVEEEQQGKDRAEYGSYLLRHLSARLTREFGKGLNYTNLKYVRQFYQTYPIGHALRDQSSAGDFSDQGNQSAIRDALRHDSVEAVDSASDNPVTMLNALRRELRWTHYRLLIRVEKPEAREWYMNEAADQNWSTRALERQINSLYYERLLMSRDKTPVVEEMREKTEPLASLPEDFIKDPYSSSFSEYRTHTNSARRNSSRPSSGSYRPSCSNWARASRSSPVSTASAPRLRTSSSIWSSTTTY